jgi:hypothetical protein
VFNILGVARLVEATARLSDRAEPGDVHRHHRGVRDFFDMMYAVLDPRIKYEEEPVAVIDHSAELARGSQHPRLVGGPCSSCAAAGATVRCGYGWRPHLDACQPAFDPFTTNASRWRRPAASMLGADFMGRACSPHHHGRASRLPLRRRHRARLPHRCVDRADVGLLRRLIDPLVQRLMDIMQSLPCW